MSKQKSKAHALAVRSETKVLARESLLEKIDEYLESGKIRDAEKICQKLLKDQPRDCEVMDIYSEILINCGEYQKALEMLTESIKLEPNVSAAKYFNFAQIAANPEHSAAALDKGLEILLKQREHQLATKDEALLFTLMQIGSAFAQKCELFMSEPLCMRNDAEAVCEASMAAAIDYCPSSPEVLVQLASLRFVQALTRLDSINSNQQQIDQELAETKAIIDSLVTMIEKSPEFAYDTNLVLKLVRLCLEPALSLREPALGVLNAAIEANDMEPEFLWLKALILSQINQLEESIESLMEYKECCESNGIDLDPDFEVILEKLKSGISK